MTGGSIYKTLDAVGQFVLVHHPVTKRAGIVQAGILVAEPAIVHDEEFASHGGDIRHHLVHAGFVDIEINAFPAVQENHTFPVAMHDLVRTGPVVEIARGTAQALVRIGKGKFRSAEAFALAESQRAVVRTDAREKAVIV